MRIVLSAGSSALGSGQETPSCVARPFSPRGVPPRAVPRENIPAYPPARNGAIGTPFAVEDRVRPFVAAAFASSPAAVLAIRYTAIRIPCLRWSKHRNGEIEETRRRARLLASVAAAHILQAQLDRKARVDRSICELCHARWRQPDQAIAIPRTLTTAFAHLPKGPPPRAQLDEKPLSRLVASPGAARR